MSGPDLDGGRIYFAPAGTAPPTMADLGRSGDWVEIGRTAEFFTKDAYVDPRAAEMARTTALSYAEAEEAVRSWDDFSTSLEIVFRKPEPYRPNRADRRAAARRGRQS